MQINFGTSMYSDPAMRPHLQKLYDEQYAVMNKRIDGMEQDGGAPETLKFTTPDGKVHEGRELSAQQYRAAIPSFDKWLDVQKEGLSIFDSVSRSESLLTRAEQALEHFKQNDPDTPSGVQTVFADGDKILGYINEDGGLVTHTEGGVLQKLSEQADKLGLSRAAKIAYLKKHGAAELSRHYPNVQVIEYDKETMPTKRAFAERWYPAHDVEGRYNSTLSEMQQHVRTMRETYQRQMETLNQMRAFLIQSIQDAGAGADEETSEIETAEPA